MSPNGHIFERVMVSRKRVIPLEGTVLVKKGDAVAPRDPVARADTVPGDPYVVDLVSDLGLKPGPGQIAKAVLKRVGDRVRRKEPVARLTSGPFSDVREACSPVDGVIEFISHTYGRILVREDLQKAAPVVVVNVAGKLDVPPLLLRAYMRYREGDEVRQGTIIADCPGAVGLAYCHAPVTGTVEKVCTRTGTVTIVRPFKPSQVDAYLLGEVAEVHPGRGATVRAVASFVQGVFGLGFENSGPLRVAVKGPAEILNAAAVRSEHAGAILVGGANVTLEALRRAVDLGVNGIISGGADHGDLAALLGREIGVGITGQEELGLTLVLTEGFGTMPMALDTFSLLRRAEGRLVSLNGSTQVRAGVIRPEVIVPVEGDDTSAARSLEECLEEREQRRGEATLGARVRIVRNPKFGQWGRIVRLPDEPALFETEARLPAAEVELEDGSRTAVPLANLEVF